MNPSQIKAKPLTTRDKIFNNFRLKRNKISCTAELRENAKLFTGPARSNLKREKERNFFKKKKKKR